MKARRMMALGMLWSVMFAVATSLAAPVPDTGVTKCYDDAGVITCPGPGQRFYGQDGNYLINPPSYTKLDANGSALPDSADSWAMVRDNVTGLIWEAKRNKDGVKNYIDPHDADNTYTWYDPNPTTNGGNPGTPGEGTDTKDFLDALNSARFGGFDDWRLPTIKELVYLVDYTIMPPGPTINTTYFPNNEQSPYWSSTTYADDTGQAWHVHFWNAELFWDEKSGNHYVRAVRGGQPQTIFVDNGDGTVTDTSTGLMWQQDTARDNQGFYAPMTWEEALVYCEGLTLGGHTDWRLPNLKEIVSLADYTRCNPAIKVFYFPNTDSHQYWSSTTHAFHSDTAWALWFGLGHSGYNYKRGSRLYVRAVRGGQAEPAPNVDIKANGSDGPVVVSSGIPVSVTVGLDPGQYAGFNADWWIAVKTPFQPPSDWYTYVYPTGWQPGIHLCAQTSLFAFSGFELLYMGLPLGHYTFYFALDPPDGVPTAELLDSVAVEVTPWSADTWQEIKPLTKPPARSGHSMAYLNGGLYVFGGQGGTSGEAGSDGGALLNDLWRFDERQLKWNQLVPSNPPPPARHSHAATAVNGKMVVFFGMGVGTGQVLSDIWSYDPVSNTWKEEPSTGTTPGPRYLHTATRLEDGSVAVFGGLCPSGATDPYVYVWAPATGQWVQKNAVPGGSLYGHSTVGIGTGLYIFGGYGALGYTSQVVLFDVRENHGVKLPVEGQLPPARKNHVATVIDTPVGKNIFIFGGTGMDEAPLNDTWSFARESLTWTKRNDMPLSLCEGTGDHLLVGLDSPSGLEAPSGDPGDTQEQGTTPAVLLFGGMNQGVPVDRTFLYRPEGAP